MEKLKKLQKSNKLSFFRNNFLLKFQAIVLL